MGWDDSDDDWDQDEDDVDAKLAAHLKEQEKQRRRDLGEDSESEEEIQKGPAPPPKADPSEAFERDEYVFLPDDHGPIPLGTRGKVIGVADKMVKVKFEGFKEDVYEPAKLTKAYTALANASKEKARKQRLIEEQDALLADDLFGGAGTRVVQKDEEVEETVVKKDADQKAKKAEVIVVDAFDAVELKTQTDIDQLVSTCVDKITKGKAKGSALKFLVDTLKAVESHLEMADLAAIDKLFLETLKAKKVTQTAMEANKRKTNEKMSKTTKFNAHAAVDEMYGGADDWYDDDDY